MHTTADLTSNIQILAVEDDLIYAETLELVLQDLGYNHFDIVDNAAAAIKIFNQRKPDIVLADIGINGPINGIELVEIITKISTVPVVYITAFTDKETFHKAKGTKPSAYVVKPYHTANLQAAIELALQNASCKENNQTSTHEKPADVYRISDFLFIKYNSRLFKIKISEILYIEVEEKYCFIHISSKKYAVNMRLKNLLEQFPDHLFMQVHRSFAVRMDAIEEVNLEDSVVKIANKEIPIGKTFRDAFFNKLKII